MIIFFGPTGSGKSMQGQLLAARHGWRWISAGQLLRDVSDPSIYEALKNGQLVPDEYINKLILNSVDDVRNADDIQRVILDGYPRTVDQAGVLFEHNKAHGESIDIVVVLNITEKEILKRLRLRGRMEDSPEIISDRLKQYSNTIQPILDFLSSKNVPVVQIDGVGSVGAVHDRIEKTIEEMGAL